MAKPVKSLSHIDARNTVITQLVKDYIVSRGVKYVHLYREKRVRKSVFGHSIKFYELYYTAKLNLPMLNKVLEELNVRAYFDGHNLRIYKWSDK